LLFCSPTQLFDVPLDPPLPKAKASFPLAELFTNFFRTKSIKLRNHEFATKKD